MTNRNNAAVAGEMSVGNVLTTYPRQWIVMAVTQTDDVGDPRAGYVVGHSRSWAAAAAAMRSDAPLRAGSLGYFVFFSNPAGLPASMRST